MIPEEQHKLLAEDLARAEEAGLVLCQTRSTCASIRTYHIQPTVDLTVNKRRVLEEYLVITYPDVKILINGTVKRIYVWSIEI